MRYLIINADGYGFTAGISKAIEECIAFGTVRSLSANVNFEHAGRLAQLSKKYPELSVGCHINPIVGTPVLPAHRVPTLLDDKGYFLYRNFLRHYVAGYVSLSELRAEMAAQVQKTRELAGKAFSHVDFHMGMHRLPQLYNLFLEIAAEAGVGRIRSDRYLVGMESRFSRLRHVIYLLAKPVRIPKLAWNHWINRKATRRGFSMPDRRVEITGMPRHPKLITVDNYVTMLRQLPKGFNEFIAHPAYLDDDLRKWSSYLDPRHLELQVLLSDRFRDALIASDVQLVGYRDIPVQDSQDVSLYRSPFQITSHF